MITQALSFDDEESNLMFYQLDKPSGDLERSIIMFWFRSHPDTDKISLEFCGHVSNCGVKVEGKQFKAKVEGLVWETPPVPQWATVETTWAEPDGFVWTITAANT